jgi:hypothetical protein
MKIFYNSKSSAQRPGNHLLEMQTPREIIFTPVSLFLGEGKREHLSPKLYHYLWSWVPFSSG